MQVTRLLLGLYGQEECERSFGALHLLDGQKLGEVRDVLLNHLREEGEVDKEGLKRALRELLVGTPALDEGFHGPEVLHEASYRGMRRRTWINAPVVGHDLRVEEVREAVRLYQDF